MTTASIFETCVASSSIVAPYRLHSLRNVLIENRVHLPLVGRSSRLVWSTITRFASSRNYGSSKSISPGRDQWVTSSPDAVIHIFPSPRYTGVQVGRVLRSVIWNILPVFQFDQLIHDQKMCLTVSPSVLSDENSLRSWLLLPYLAYKVVSWVFRVSCSKVVAPIFGCSDIGGLLPRHFSSCYGDAFASCSYRDDSDSLR
jgi:hypothetical protein